MTGSAALDQVEGLIALTEQLTRQIGGDADALEARRTHDVAARIGETVRLAALFRHETARVQGDPRLLAAATGERRVRLIRASQDFERTLKRHGKALYAAKTVTEGIVRAIADEVVKARAVGAAYGPAARRPQGDPTAVTLNRRA